MRDIHSRKDIEFLVDSFYKKILIDEKIGFFFTEVVELDWDKHIPIMYDFWETTLLGKAKYKGNPMIKHINLHRKKIIKKEHFDRWLSIWKNTINASFDGEKSEEAIKKAEQIGGLMKFKIEQQTNKN